MKKHFLVLGEYSIKQSTIPGAGMGAFTEVFLQSRTVIGNYRGKKLSKKQYENLKNDSYVWELSRPKGGPVYIDGANKKNSNWLRYLNDAKDDFKTNVEPYQYKQKLYYRTIKDIIPGSELFISYGDDYW